jgi:predicted nucleotidyltransferase
MPRNDELFAKVAELLKGYGASRVGIFGSYARGEERPGSDLDVMVEFSGRKSLLDIIGIEQDVSERLGVKVELMSERSISPYLIDRIRKELVTVY